jgi:putative FmdB family regulatory protein
MPLYEYHCDECDSDFEELVSARVEDDDVICPTCGATKVERVQSGFAIAGCSHGESISSCGSRGGFG